VLASALHELPGAGCGAGAGVGLALIAGLFMRCSALQLGRLAHIAGPSCAAPRWHGGRDHREAASPESVCAHEHRLRPAAKLIELFLARSGSRECNADRLVALALLAPLWRFGHAYRARCWFWGKSPAFQMLGAHAAGSRWWA
jgi:hypothetical protein